MDDALRAPAGLPWITMMPLSTAPTFAHNLHSLHHYEKKSLQTKIQGRKPRNAPARSGQRRSLWGLDARSLVERDALAGTLRSAIPPMPGYWLTPLHYLPLGATGNGALAA
jgi:hypothetical protein